MKTIVYSNDYTVARPGRSDLNVSIRVAAEADHYTGETMFEVERYKNGRWTKIEELPGHFLRRALKDFIVRIMDNNFKIAPKKVGKRTIKKVISRRSR